MGELLPMGEPYHMGLIMWLIPHSSGPTMNQNACPFAGFALIKSSGVPPGPANQTDQAELAYLLLDSVFDCSS